MRKKYLNPPTLFDSVRFGFSQAISCDGGRTVYISGQTAWDSGRMLVGGTNLREQAGQALRNIRTAVESAGGTVDDIVSLRIYVVEGQPAAMTTVGEALRDFFPAATPPTSTWIGVSSLAVKDFLIEIEAVAVIG